eukprot:g5394.t1
MSGLFQRIAQWLANELIIERLAKSSAFQRFAMKTVRAQEKTAEIGKKAGEKIAEKSTMARDETASVFQELKAAARKDLGIKETPQKEVPTGNIFDRIKTAIKEDLAREGK